MQENTHNYKVYVSVNKYQITACSVTKIGKSLWPNQILEYYVFMTTNHRILFRIISVLKMEKILFSETLVHVRPYTIVAQNSVILSSES